MLHGIQKGESVTSRYHGSKNLWITTMGSLSNDDGDGNENGKKSVRLHQKNNNFARGSRFTAVVA